MNNKQKKLAIALPGGGAKGINQAVVWSDLDKKLSTLIPDYKGLGYYVDYIGGTSIGSLHAIRYCIKDNDGKLKFSPESNIQMYLDHAGKILLPMQGLGSGIINPYYSNDIMEKMLDDICGSAKFCDNKLTAKVLISSYCLEKNAPTLWSNIGIEKDRQKLQYHVWNIKKIKIKDAILASSAIPIFFEAHEVKYQRDATGRCNFNEIDGAFVTNSPIMELISDIVCLDKVNLSNLFLLSIGTGKSPSNYKLSSLSDAGGYEYLMNIKPLLSTHLQAVQDISENNAAKIVDAHGGKCRFIDMPLTVDQNSIIDTLESLNAYKKMTEGFLKANDDYIDGIAKELAEWINES